MELFLLILKYLFLGALQGFTEPIPFSSSGHLVITQYLFGMKIEGLSFEMFVNTASLLAVFVIYKEDIKRLISSSSWKDALLVGLGQAAALIPGISRSGATIVTAMLIGMKQESALRFSFLLYIPVSHP